MAKFFRCERCPLPDHVAGESREEEGVPFVATPVAEHDLTLRALIGVRGIAAFDQRSVVSTICEPPSYASSAGARRIRRGVQLREQEREHHLGLSRRPRDPQVSPPPPVPPKRPTPYSFPAWQRLGKGFRRIAPSKEHERPICRAFRYSGGRI